MRNNSLPLGILLVAGVCLFGSACRSSHRKTSKARTAEDTRRIGATGTPTVWQTRLGRIVLVNSSQDFVLIDAGTAPVPEPGTRLRAYSNGQLSAELSVGSHQQRPFLIADIVSGVPLVSDMVVPVRPTSSKGGDQPAAKQGVGSEAATAVSPSERTPKGFAETGEIPQIERRPPPPARSLLTPVRPMGNESDAIIPGLPSPGKAPVR
jgi:hypothetical protein